MAQRRRRDENYNDGTWGVSEKALKALDTGTYGQLTGRKSKYRTSQEQTQQTQDFPMLEGMFTEAKPKTWERKFGKSGIDTDRARRNYAAGHTPIGRGLTKKDADLIANGALNMLNNNISADQAANSMRSEGITSSYARNKDWEKEYGKTLETLIEEYANSNEAMSRHFSEVGRRGNGLSKTVGSMGMNAFIKPAMAARTIPSNIISPDSERTNKLNKAAAAMSEVAQSAKDSTTRNAGTIGKGLYDFGTNVGERISRDVTPFGWILNGLATAEDVRQELSKEGVSNRKSAGYGLARGTLDAIASKFAGKLGQNSKGANFATRALKSGAKQGTLGGIEQTIAELADAAILGDEGTYNRDVQNYMARGLSEEEARDRAWENTLLRIGGMAATRGTIGAVTSLGGDVVKGVQNKLKDLAYRAYINRYVVDPDDPIFNEPIVDIDDLNEYFAPQNALEGQAFPQLTGTVDNTQALTGSQYNVPALVDNIYPIQMPGTNGVINLPGETAPIQLPDLAAKSAPVNTASKIMNESIGWTNPRLVQKLEGEDLVKALNQVATNNKRTNALKNEIEILKNDKANYYRGNLKKAIQQKIKGIEKEITGLAKSNKDLNLQMKGGLKPVLDMLTTEQKNAIYDTSGKHDSVFSKINFASKFAGDTPESRALAKTAQNAVREYVKTGSKESLDALRTSLTELDNMAKSVNATWTSNKGNKWDYNSAFGDQAMYLEQLTPVAEIYIAEQQAAKAAAQTAQSTPVEAPATTPATNKVDFTDDYNNIRNKINNGFNPTDTVEVELINDSNVMNTHTPEELQVMRDYLDSTDRGLVDFVNNARNSNYSTNDSYSLMVTNAKAADAIKKVTGRQTEGFETVIETRGLEHLDKDHGVAGKADHSMADPETIARIKYVLENFDGYAEEPGTTQMYTEPSKVNPKNAKGAKTIKFYKKVNGNYYVVEAVPDTAAQKNYIVSAYTDSSKNNGSLQSLDVQAPSSTSKTKPQSSVDIVPQLPANVNTPEPKPQDVQTPDNGYWLRLLGDDAFLAEEAQKNNIDPQEFRAIAANNIGYEPTVGGSDVPPINPPGGNVPPVPPNDIPNGNGKQRERGMSRHMGDEEKMTVDIPQEVKDNFINDPDMYEQLSNKSTKERAVKIYNDYPEERENIFRDMLSKHDPASLPLGQMIAKDYSANGNHAAAAQLFRDMGEQLTKAGQFTQASILTMLKNDPLTAAQYAQKAIDKLNVQGQKEFGKKWHDLSLTDEELEAFNNIEPGDEKALADLYDKIGQRLGKEYPSTVMERLLEGRKVAMLFNMRTISRNFFANPPTLGMRYIADRIESLGQSAVHLIDPTFEKTQSIRSGGTGRKIAKEFTKTERYQKLVHGVDEKHTVPDLKSEIIHHKQMYKGTAAEKFIDRWAGDAFNSISDALYNANITKNNPHIDGGIQALNSKLYNKENVQSILETIRNTTYKLLDVTDSPFVKENFVERLGSYLNAQNIKSIDDIPDDAIQVAWDEALKATYKDDSWMVKALRGIKGGIEKVPVIGKPLSQGLIPFLQAPGNIGARIFDYSPINGAVGVERIIEGAVKKDHDMIRKGIEQVAKGLTGTGLAYLGMKLYKSGILTGDYSADNKEKSFQERNGFRPWSLHVGDKYFSFDWMQPFAQNIMSGILIQQAIDNSDDFDSDVLRHFGIEGSQAGKFIGAAYQGGKSAINAWFDETPLGDITKLFEGNYYDRDIAQNTVDVGGDFVGGMYPATLNSLAKTIDTTKRNTKDASNKFSTYLNQQIAKVPFLSKTLPIKYDTWGEEIKYSDSNAEAAFQRFAFPGDYSSDSADPLDVEIQKLFKETNDNRVFPFYAATKVGDKVLNNEESSAYQQDMGQRSKAFARAFVNSEQYQNMSPADRVETLNKLYYTSKAITERDLFDKAVSDSSEYKKYVNAYDEAGGGEKGVEAVINFSEAKSAMKDSGLSATSNLGKKVEAAAKAGNDEVVEQITSAAKSIDELGFTKVNPKETYIKAKGLVPSLTPEEFAETYRAIDGADGSTPNEGIKQDEVIAYLNKGNYSYDAGMEIWNMYAPNGKMIPYLKDEKTLTWGKKKPK